MGIRKRRFRSGDTMHDIGCIFFFLRNYHNAETLTIEPNDMKADFLLETNRGLDYLGQIKSFSMKDDEYKGIPSVKGKIKKAIEELDEDKDPEKYILVAMTNRTIPWDENEIQHGEGIMTDHNGSKLEVISFTAKRRVVVSDFIDYLENGRTTLTEDQKKMIDKVITSAGNYIRSTEDPSDMNHIISKNFFRKTILLLSIIEAMKCNDDKLKYNETEWFREVINYDNDLTITNTIFNSAVDYIHGNKSEVDFFFAETKLKNDFVNEFVRINCQELNEMEDKLNVNQ